jgi:SAM-dependent methyltransferase
LGDVAAHFESRAHDYAGGQSWVNDPISLEPVDDLIARCPDAEVLEIGSGTGAVARFIADNETVTSRFTCLDVAPAMLRQVPTWCDRVVGDAHRLPLGANSFDIVICRQSFHYFESPRLALSEIDRVLRPGGRVLIAQILPFSNPSDEAWWRSVVALRQPLRRNLLTSGEIVHLLRECRFAIERTDFIERRTSLAAWLDRYPLDSDTRSRVLDRFIKAPEEVAALRKFIPTSNDVEYSLRWAFIVAREPYLADEPAKRRVGSGA